MLQKTRRGVRRGSARRGLAALALAGLALWLSGCGEVGPQGPPGPQGPQGDPLAPHEWAGTLLRFQYPDLTWGAWVDLLGPQGTVGPAGPQGLKGDAPAHEWLSTQLRFQNPGGTWGSYVDLEGPQGIQGPQGPQGIPGNDGLWSSYGQSISAGRADEILEIRNTGSGYGIRVYSNMISVYGETSSASHAGVWGVTSAVNGQGVYGTTFSSTGKGVYGFAPGANGVGVYGSGGMYGGRFNSLGVDGDAIVAGNLSKGSGSFLIDHPCDPYNKVLRHSFVESPDMKNIYDGVVRLDAKGQAVVSFPRYFDALNMDFRYQLTAIGASMPGLHVKTKMTGRTFAIAGGAPGGEVSWQVTGVRKDGYAMAHRIVVEEEKGTGTASRYTKGELVHEEAGMKAIAKAE